MGSDTQSMEAFITMEMASRQQPEEMRASKVAELEKYTAMLANPHLPQEAKLNVGVLLTNVAKELSSMQQLSVALHSAALVQPRHQTGRASQLQATQSHRKPAVYPAGLSAIRRKVTLSQACALC